MSRRQLSLDLRDTKRTRIRNFPWKELARALSLAVLLVWAAWVTRELVARPTNSVVKLNLAGLVQEYMIAASHSNWTADQIRTQTGAFTGAIDDQIAAYARDGTTVLMTEAVLSKNVPDITPRVRAAILKKVAWPAPGTAGVIAPLVPRGTELPDPSGGAPLPGGADVRP